MITMPLNEWITLEAFCSSCTIPILYETSEKAGILGTGLLFCLNGHHVVVTASHVADEVLGSPDSAGVPVGTGLINDIHPFAGCDVVSPSTVKDKDYFDAALINLDGSTMLQKLKDNFDFLTLDNIAANNEISSEFLVAGYPDSRAVPLIKPGTLDKRIIIGDFFKFQTQEYRGAIEEHQKADPRNYIFVSYDTALTSNTGLQVPAPKLQGISGCPIWTFVPSKPEQIMWTPRNIIKVAAVEMSCVWGAWIRGIRWHAVAHAFGHIDKDAKEMLNDKVFGKIQS
jgi:hypothetical protein